MRRCDWCRNKLGDGELAISNQVAGEARRAHAKYQIELLGKADAFKGYTNVCSECATAVRKGIVAIYLERRKSAPENVEQLEDLEEKTRELERLRLEAVELRRLVELDNSKLREQLATQKRQLQRSVELLSVNVEELLAAKNEMAAEAVEGELEPEERKPTPGTVSSNPWPEPTGPAYRSNY
jgi:hypothetical protein